jgi:hypothetical protein
MIQNSAAFLENPGSPFKKTKQEISKRVSQKSKRKVHKNKKENLLLKNFRQNQEICVSRKSRFSIQKTKQEISKRVFQKQESEILDIQEFRKNHDFLEYLKIQKEKSTKTKRRTYFSRNFRQKIGRFLSKKRWVYVCSHLPTTKYKKQTIYAVKQCHSKPRFQLQLFVLSIVMARNI